MFKNNKITKFKINYKKGFTLLLAVLITSIMLGISFGFSVFVLRELKISALGRESQKAFFAADSGMECVLYWDIKKDSFKISQNTTNISCAGGSYPVGGPTGISSFVLNFDNYACANVIVDKTTSQTLIKSYGYNTCDSNNPNRVERALKVTY